MARERLEGEGEVGGRLEAFGGTLFEAVVNDLVQPDRHAGVGRRNLGGILLRDGGHRLGRGFSREGPTAREHLVEDRAERKNVRAMVRGLAAHLLGRHVADRSHDRARLGRGDGGRGLRAVARAAGDAGEAEVENLDVTGFRHEDVLGLQVAVDDSLPVRGRQAVGNLDAVLDGLPDGQRSGREPRRAASRPRAAP